MDMITGELAKRRDGSRFAQWMSGPAVSRALHLFFIPGQWLLARFSRTDEQKYALLWIVAFWALMAIPAVMLRAVHMEEGTVLGLARGAVEDGHWLAPFRYGVRFVERPVLLSWIAAALGEVTGGVTVLTVRIPHLLFLLAGAWLVYDLVKATAGKAAGLFGALCWFASPMVAQKFVTAEPDVTLSVLLFAVFCVWWKSLVVERLTPARWLLIGVLIGLAGLTKGPQPVAYVTLGIGAYLLLKRRFADLPPFLLANLLAALIIGSWYLMVAVPHDAEAWAVHSRILTSHGTELVSDHIDFLISMMVEWLPGLILLVPALVILARKERNSDHDLMLAAVLYALMCTLVLVVWPGGIATRYAMPGTLGLAVVAGLMFARWRQRHSRVIVVTLVTAYVIAVFVMVLGWVAMPLKPDWFQESKIAGQTIDALRRDVPGPVYVVTQSAEHNMLAYVRGPVREVALGRLTSLAEPSLAVLTEDEETALARKKPTLHLIDRATVRSQKMDLKVVEIRP